MPRPDYAIVIPTRGDSYRLRVALRSLNFGLPLRASVEVVVIRDGAEPALPPDVADDHIFPLRQLYTGERSGPAAARNLGANATTADTLVFMDDDVIIPQDWFAGLESVSSRLNDGWILGGPIRARTPENLVSQVFESFVIRHHHSATGLHLATACMVVGRREFETLGGFDAEFAEASGEDWDFSSRAHAAGFRVAEVPELLVYHWNPTRFAQLLSRAARYASSSHLRARRAGGHEPATARFAMRPILTAFAAVGAVRELVRRYGMARELHGRARSALLVMLHVPWFVTYGLAVRRTNRAAGVES